MVGLLWNRKERYCSKCKHPWLLEREQCAWQGSGKELHLYEKERERKRGLCYCGTPLYAKNKINSEKKEVCDV